MKKLYKDTMKGKSYFYYYGWTILAFLISFYLIAFLIMQAMFYIPRANKIEIFIAAQGLKDDEYSQKIQKEFEEDGLMEVNVYSYLENDTKIYDFFSANGESADFVIFSETNVTEMQDYVLYNYVDLDSIKTDVPSLASYETFKYDVKSFGIKIYDGSNVSYNSNHHFDRWIEFTNVNKANESYYLLVDVDSPNFDKDNNHTLGYSVLEYLLSSMLVD